MTWLTTLNNVFLNQRLNLNNFIQKDPVKSAEYFFSAAFILTIVYLAYKLHALYVDASFYLNKLLMLISTTSSNEVLQYIKVNTSDFISIISVMITIFCLLLPLIVGLIKEILKSIINLILDEVFGFNKIQAAEMEFKDKQYKLEKTLKLNSILIAKLVDLKVEILSSDYHKKYLDILNFNNYSIDVHLQTCYHPEDIYNLRDAHLYIFTYIKSDAASLKLNNTDIDKIKNELTYYINSQFDLPFLRSDFIFKQTELLCGKLKKPRYSIQVNSEINNLYKKTKLFFDENLEDIKSLSLKIEELKSAFEIYGEFSHDESIEELQNYRNIYYNLINSSSLIYAFDEVFKNKNVSHIEKLNSPYENVGNIQLFVVLLKSLPFVIFFNEN